MNGTVVGSVLRINCGSGLRALPPSIEAKTLPPRPSLVFAATLPLAGPVVVVKKRQRPLVIKALSPNKDGKQVAVEDGEIRWAMAFRPELKYYDAIAAGRVFYRRFSDRIEIVLQDEKTQVLLDTVDIAPDGSLIDSNTGKALFNSANGTKKPLKIPNDSRCDVQFLWAFSEVATLCGALAINDRLLIFGFGSVEFSVSNDERLLLWDSITSGRLFLECSRRGVLVFVHEAGVEEPKLLGEAQFDHDSIVQKEGKPYLLDGLPVEVFGARKCRVALADFVPVLGVKDIPVSVFQQKGNPRFFSSVRFGGLRFSFNTRKGNEWSEAILGGRVFLRVGQKDKIEVVVKSGKEVKSLGSFNYAADGAILDGDGKPVLYRGEPLKFDSKRKKVPHVPIDLLVPAAASVTGKVGLYQNKKGRGFAKFCVNAVAYHVSCDTRNKYWQALSEGRLCYRYQRGEISVFEVVGEKELEIGKVKLDQHGRPDEAALCGEKRVVLADLLPQIDCLRVRMQLRKAKRGGQQAGREVEIFMLANDGHVFRLDFTNPQLLYRDVCLRGDLFLEVVGERVRVLQRVREGVEAVIGEVVFADAKTTTVSLAKLVPALYLKDAAQAEALYAAQYRNFLDKGKYQNARNALYKMLGLGFGGGVVPLRIRYLDFLLGEPGFEAIADYWSSVAREEIWLRNLAARVASGYSAFSPLVAGREYGFLPLCQALAVSEDEVFPVRSNAIFLLGELGAKLDGEKGPRERELLHFTLGKIVEMHSSTKMRRFASLLELAYQKCVGSLPDDCSPPGFQERGLG